MREEETTVGVVRIGVRVRVLVVLPVVAHPHVQAVLAGQRVQPQQEHFEWRARLERAMRPQPMGAHRNAQPGAVHQGDGWPIRVTKDRWVCYAGTQCLERGMRDAPSIIRVRNGSRNCVKLVLLELTPYILTVQRGFPVWHAEGGQQQAVGGQRVQHHKTDGIRPDDAPAEREIGTNVRWQNWRLGAQLPQLGISTDTCVMLMLFVVMVMVLMVVRLLVVVIVVLLLVAAVTRRRGNERLAVGQRQRRTFGIEGILRTEARCLVACAAGAMSHLIGHIGGGRHGWSSSVQ